MTVQELIDKYGGPTSFGRAIDIKPSAASEMKRRKSIPVRYWPSVVASAHDHNIEGVDYETLVRMHSIEPAQAAQ